MTRFTSLLAATVLTPVAAFAAGPEPLPVQPVVVAPAAVASTDWTGFYAGGQLGYGFGEFNLDPSDIDELDADGIIGGVHAGYMWDFGQWVLGGEVQYDAADLSVSGDDGTGSFDDIARLKLRAGYDLGQTLVYGTVGAAYANFSGTDATDLDVNIDDSGYLVGFGVDYKINQSWVVGGEYMYHQFDDFGSPGNDVDVNTIHLRASYQF